MTLEYLFTQMTSAESIYIAKNLKTFNKRTVKDKKYIILYLNQSSK